MQEKLEKNIFICLFSGVFRILISRVPSVNRIFPLRVLTAGAISLFLNITGAIAPMDGTHGTHAKYATVVVTRYFLRFHIISVWAKIEMLLPKGFQPIMKYIPSSSLTWNQNGLHSDLVQNTVFTTKKKYIVVQFALILPGCKTLKGKNIEGQQVNQGFQIFGLCNHLLRPWEMLIDNFWVQWKHYSKQ